MIQHGQAPNPDDDVVVTEKGHPLYALTVPRSHMARYKLSKPVRTSTTYAWCFDHGNLHHFSKDGTPWCTAAWVAFTATTEADALAAKHAAYGDAQFLNDLPADKQIEVIEIAKAHREAP